MLKKFFKGFSIAEILIALLVIGIVAVITLPILRNYQKQEFYSAFKKEYNSFSNATKLMATINNGSLWDSSSINLTTRSKSMRDEYAKYLSAIDLDTIGNIFNYTFTAYDARNGTIDVKNGNTSTGDSYWVGFFMPTSSYAMILKDGAFASFASTPNCSAIGGDWGENQSPITHYYCGYIVIDVNGATPPNRFGVDIYSLWVTQPAGDEQYRVDPGNAWSSQGGMCGYTNGAYSWWLYGFGCGQYVLQNKTLPFTGQSF